MPKTRSKSKRVQETRVKLSPVQYMNRMLRRTMGVLTSKINQLEERFKLNSTSNSVTYTPPPTLPNSDTYTPPPTLRTSIILDENPTAIPEFTVPLVQEDHGPPKNVYYTLQNNNIEKPKYPGKNDIHPVSFIEDLTSYLKRIPTPTGGVVDLIIECLEGETRNWARICRERWQNLEDFKSDFLNTYWGDTEQNNLRRKIVCNTWDKSKHSSMLEHFISLTGQAKMLAYPIPEKQLINDIMQHFPKQVQYVWTTNPASTIIEAAEFLRRIDNIEKQNATMEQSEKLHQPSSSNLRPQNPKANSNRFVKQKTSSGRQTNAITTEANVINVEDNINNISENVNLSQNLNM